MLGRPASSAEPAPAPEASAATQRELEAALETGGAATSRRSSSPSGWTRARASCCSTSRRAAWTSASSRPPRRRAARVPERRVHPYDTRPVVLTTARRCGWHPLTLAGRRFLHLTDAALKDRADRAVRELDEAP